MATNRVTIMGYIKDGKLEVDLPANAVDGEVQIIVPVAGESEGLTDAPPAQYPSLTDEEIEALMRPNPKSGAEIARNPAIGAWAHRGIEDSVTWLEEQRRKRRDKRRW